MSCNEPYNKTTEISFNIKARTPYLVVTQFLYKHNRAPIDMTGWTFESRFLDEEGGSILKEAVVTFVGDPTNATIKELVEEADVLADLIGDRTEEDTIFWEFFAINAEGVREKWFIATVGIELAGE